MRRGWASEASPTPIPPASRCSTVSIWMSPPEASPSCAGPRGRASPRSCGCSTASSRTSTTASSPVGSSSGTRRSATPRSSAPACAPPRSSRIPPPNSSRPPWLTNSPSRPRTTRSPRRRSGDVATRPWRRWASPTWPTGSCAAYPAARPRRSPAPRPWPSRPPSSSWTSPPPTWTRGRLTTCALPSNGSNSPAGPSWWPSTASTSCADSSTRPSSWGGDASCTG